MLDASMTQVARSSVPSRPTGAFRSRAAPVVCPTHPPTSRNNADACRGRPADHDFRGVDRGSTLLSSEMRKGGDSPSPERRTHPRRQPGPSRHDPGRKAGRPRGSIVAGRGREGGRGGVGPGTSRCASSRPGESIFPPAPSSPEPKGDEILRQPAPAVDSDRCGLHPGHPSRVTDLPHRDWVGRYEGGGVGGGGSSSVHWAAASVRTAELRGLSVPFAVPRSPTAAPPRKEPGSACYGRGQQTSPLSVRKGLDWWLLVPAAREQGGRGASEGGPWRVSGAGEGGGVRLADRAAS